MTGADRTQLAATLSLVAGLLAYLCGLWTGLAPLLAVQVAGLAYAASLALLGSTLQVSILAIVVQGAKIAGLTAVASVVIACSGTYAGWQLLRGRPVKVVTA